MPGDDPPLAQGGDEHAQNRGTREVNQGTRRRFGGPVVRRLCLRGSSPDLRGSSPPPTPKRIPCSSGPPTRRSHRFVPRPRRLGSSCAIGWRTRRTRKGPFATGVTSTAKITHGGALCTICLRRARMSGAVHEREPDNRQLPPTAGPVTPPSSGQLPASAFVRYGSGDGAGSSRSCRALGTQREGYG